jgi:hypothetical protein
MAKVMIGVDYGVYSFDALAKQVTITLNSGTPVLEGVLLITNTTDNIIIYNFANPALGGTLSGNVLTLDYDTTAMSDTDSLQIWYYNEEPLAVLDETVSQLCASITQLANILSSNAGMPDTAGRLRVLTDTTSNIAGVNTVGTITTLSTLTGQTNIGGLAAVMQVPSNMQIPIEIQNQKILVT